MKRSFKNFVVVSAILAQSPWALAGRSYHSSVSGIDLGVVYQPPANVGAIICENYKKDPETGKDDSDLYEACSMGVNAARWMAEKYAQGEGQYLGCLDGMMQGIDRGFVGAKDPSSAQIEEARRKYSAMEMQTAIDRATDLAQDQGQSVADDEIIRRFRGVVGTDQVPDDSYTYPDHSFDGYENGYTYDNHGGDFGPVYDAGWVSSRDSYDKRLKARAVYRLHRNDYSPSGLCQANNVIIDTRHNNLWDYFEARRDHDFKVYGWKNVNRVWNYFVDDVKGTAEKLFYLNIEGKTEQYVEEVLVQEAEYDEDGNLIRDAVYENVIRTRTVPGRGKDYYQGAYKEVFKLAYDEYYRNQYFGKAFVSSHQQNRNVGELIGKTIGEKVAQDEADRIAYNAKYREDSIAAYNVEWRTNYDDQWSRIWDIFMNNAVVELNSLRLEGDKKDEIFKAGEKVKAHLGLTNLGLASGSITYSMYGDLDKAGEFREVAPASSDFRLRTPFIGKVSKSISPRDYARVGVSLSGALDYDSNLVTSKSQNLLINEVAEIDGVGVSLDYIDGQGQLRVDLVNPSSLPTSSLVGVELVLDGNLGTYEAEALRLEGKESTRASIMFNNIDPLEIIRDGGISGTVSTRMNNRVLHETRVHKNIDSKSKALARYFSALVNDEDGSVNSGTDTVEGRTQEMMEIIQHVTRRDIDRDVDWDENYEVHNTVVGQLGLQYQSAQAAGNLTDKGKKLFDQLGSILNNLEISVFKRKDYRAALNKFAPSVEVKKKDK